MTQHIAHQICYTHHMDKKCPRCLFTFSTPRCPVCISNVRFRALGSVIETPCTRCGVIRKLAINNQCPPCLEVQGLKECCKCHEVLIREMSFPAGGPCYTCQGVNHHGGGQGRYPRMPDEQREQIAKWNSEGIGGTEISKRLDCTPAMVSLVLRQKGLQGSKGGIKTYEVDQDFFETVDTEEKAYFLGLMTTDGCVSRKNDVMLALQSDDIDVLEKMRTALKSNHPISKTKPQEGGVILNSKPFLRKEQARLSISSLKLAADLTFLGVVPNKTFVCKPWLGPPDLMRHYWRGCIDGDGSISVTTKGRWGISFAGTLEMVQAFCQWCNSVNGGAVHPRPIKKIWTTSVFGSHAPLAIAEALYGSSTVYMDRKYKKYLQLKERYGSSVQKPPTQECSP